MHEEHDAVSESFDVVEVESFTAGTVGEPGERVFYLQCRSAYDTVSLRLEKGQVQALATAVEQLLDKVDAPGGGTRPLELVEPVQELWIVSALGVGWDAETERLVIVAQELTEDDDADAADAAEGRFHLTAEQARGFADHAAFLVEYGRDFGRQNGHKPH